MSDREREEFQQEKEAAAIQGDYNLKLKEMDMEIARMEAKWTNILRLPIVIITLPVRILFGLAYVIAVVRKYDPGEKFWEFLKK